MKRDRKSDFLTHFKHCETFSTEKIERIFSCSPPPARIIVTTAASSSRLWWNITPTDTDLTWCSAKRLIEKLKVTTPNCAKYSLSPSFFDGHFQIFAILCRWSNATKLSSFLVAEPVLNAPSVIAKNALQQARNLFEHLNSSFKILVSLKSGFIYVLQQFLGECLSIALAVIFFVLSREWTRSHSSLLIFFSKVCLEELVSISSSTKFLTSQKLVSRKRNCKIVKLED